MMRIGMSVRSVLAVLAGIAAMTAVAFAVEFPLRSLALRFFPQTFPDQAALDANIGWMLSQSLYTVPAREVFRVQPCTGRRAMRTLSDGPIILRSQTHSSCAATASG